MTIDIESLRKDLIDYFGSAMSFNPLAMSDLIKLENSSPEELIKIAQDNNFDLEDYELKTLN